jgi:hypothetical protein
MPFDPEEHKRKLWEIIQREFSASLMSTTRWVETLESLRSLDLAYRLKLITTGQCGPWSSAPSVGKAPHLPTGWIEGCGYSPIPLLAIEWLDVVPRWRVYRADETPGSPDEPIRQIEERLRQVGAPFTWRGSVIRIWGHHRRSNPPVPESTG